MTDEGEGYEVQRGESGKWYIVQRIMKGAVLHTIILPEQYESEEAAEAGAAALSL